MWYIILILLVIAFGCAGYSQSVSKSKVPSGEGKSIRQIVEENYKKGSFLIGATTGSWALGENQGLLLDREFSYVTPENDYKHVIVHPDPQTWNWSRADVWQQHIIDNKQILRMHCPIGPQCSKWAKDDSRQPSELEKDMKLFLQKICERYNGKQGYVYMDVVNETVVNGVWHENKSGTFLWECPWFKIGRDTDRNRTPLYIKMAFETAMKYAPDLKFIYNHHEGPEKTGSWNLIRSTINYLRERNLRVDGIGWQAHVERGWETPEHVENLKKLIKEVHSYNLEFHITEASVWLKNGKSQSELEAQADTYRAIMKTLLEMRSGGVICWNTWHISDAHGWHIKWYPSLFDENYNAKPAYNAILEELSKHND
jgi:GH35 family endo-1,4-beta-xylanase